MADDTFDPGPRPELTWLLVASLVADPAYQRTIDNRASQRSIALIAETFRWAAFGTALVSENADGTWAIIDGQHRIAAAAARGLQRVPCVVVQGATIADQAQVFLATNLNRVRLTPYALFHARVAAGEPDAVKAQQLCDNLLITIPRRPVPINEMKPGMSLAINDITRIAREEDATGITALKCLVEAFADQGGGLSVVNIRAASKALTERPRGVVALVEWFAKHEPAQLVLRYGRATQAETAMAADLIRAIDRAASAPQAGDGFIKPPTREQLMRGR